MYFDVISSSEWWRCFSCKVRLPPMMRHNYTNIIHKMKYIILWEMLCFWSFSANLSSQIIIFWTIGAKVAFLFCRTQNVAWECFSEGESAPIRSGAKFCSTYMSRFFLNFFKKNLVDPKKNKKRGSGTKCPFKVSEIGDITL